MKKRKSETRLPSPPQKLKHPSGAVMNLDKKYILVQFHGAQKGTPQPKKLGALGWKVVEPVVEMKPKKLTDRPDDKEPNNTATRLWLKSSREINLRPGLKEQTEKKVSKKIEWIGPVYKLGKGKEVSHVAPIPNVLLIKSFSTHKNAEAIADELKNFQLHRNEEKSKYLGPFAYYELTSEAADIFTIREILMRKWRLDVRFEFMPMEKPTTFIPNDTQFINQWNMNTVHAGDILLAGWDLTTGNENIIIAILDAGCDLTHPDLNFVSNGINLGSMAGDGRPTGNHGTACAGIAAAAINNNEGIAGMAGTCLLLPIAFQNWTDAEVAAGIRFATDNGAHVISMSFGQYAAQDNRAPSGWDFDLIDPAIEYAFDNGVVLVAATGNENIRAVNRYPARHPMVVAVGASDQNDNRKSPTSPDGENWGSNFGAGVSVVAPGVRIPTTDRQGRQGYVNGNYTMRFNGTSSATPHVAGLAALIKSVCPTNSPIDIRNILERTCDKTGPIAYSSSSANGTRNREMGHGRINVSEAVREGFSYLIACLL